MTGLVRVPSVPTRGALVFNRYVDGEVTYVALETGHPASQPDAASLFHELTDGQTASR